MASGYARYAAYFPAAQSFLNEQQMEQTQEPQRREISQEELVEMYTQHVLWSYGGEEQGKQAVFSDCVLSGLDMRGMQFNNAIFWNAVLEQMDMESAGVCFGEFQGAQFINCNMDNLCADEADFKDCSFDGCSLRGAKMLHCNLSNSHFRGTLLDNANLQSSCIEGMKVSEEAISRADTRNVSFDEADWIAQASASGSRWHSISIYHEFQFNSGTRRITKPDLGSFTRGGCLTHLYPPNLKYR